MVMVVDYRANMGRFSTSVPLLYRFGIDRCD